MKFYRTLKTILVSFPLIFGTLHAKADAIASAMSAGPDSISAEATVMDWNFKVLRKGTNGWTCLPDRPDTEGEDPWCVDAAWLNFLKAYVNKEEPSYEQLGFAYMLKGDSPTSNTEPYATKPSAADDWVTDLGPHMMVLAPDTSLLEKMTTDHKSGGPWVMWPNTPYVHIMVPLVDRDSAHQDFASEINNSAADK